METERKNEFFSEVDAHEKLEEKLNNFGVLDPTEIDIISGILSNELDKIPALEISISNKNTIKKGSDLNLLWPDVLYLSDSIFHPIILSALNYIIFWNAINDLYEITFNNDFDILHSDNHSDLIEFILSNYPTYDSWDNKITVDNSYDHESMIFIILRRWDLFIQNRESLWALWPSS